MTLIESPQIIIHYNPSNWFTNPIKVNCFSIAVLLNTWEFLSINAQSHNEKMQSHTQPHFSCAYAHLSSFHRALRGPPRTMAINGVVGIEIWL